MKNKVKMLAVILTLLLGLTSSVSRAQQSTTVSVETDPSTFLFNGYAFHLRIKPAGSDHLVLGAGTYALDLPGVMVDINQPNKGKGWDVRINSAYSLFGEYYFDRSNHKWFLGIQAGVQNFGNRNSNIPDTESKYSNFLLMPSVGYVWQPFDFPLYFKPWFGIGYTARISGSNTIGTLEYKISNLLPFATLHVGYTL